MIVITIEGTKSADEKISVSLDKKSFCDWCGKKFKTKDLCTSIVSDETAIEGKRKYIVASICSECNYKHDVM